MAEAYKCDISGKLYEGNGITSLEIKVSDACHLRVIPLGKFGTKNYGQGVLCPDEAARIKDAILKAYGVEEFL